MWTAAEEEAHAQVVRSDTATSSSNCARAYRQTTWKDTVIEVEIGNSCEYITTAGLIERTKLCF